MNGDQTEHNGPLSIAGYWTGHVHDINKQFTMIFYEVHVIFQ